MAEERVSIIIRARDMASRVFGRVRAALSGIAQTAKRVGIAIGAMTAAATAAVVAIGKLAQRGGEVLGVQRAFVRVVGADAPKALRELQQATGGLISRYDLMVGLNRSLTLGSAENVAQFGELAKTAIALGRALGEDAGRSLESLSLGIGRQSKLILDNLGLIVSVEQANKAYAAQLNKTTAELDDNEKRIAFRNAALDAARQKVAELGGVEETAADAVTRFNTALKDFGDTITTILAQSPFVAKFFERLKTVVTDIAAVVAAGGDRLTQGFQALGEAAGHAFIAGLVMAIRASVAGVNKATQGLFQSFLPDVVANLITFPGRKVNEFLLNMNVPAELAESSIIRVETALARLRVLAGIASREVERTGGLTPRGAAPSGGGGGAGGAGARAPISPISVEAPRITQQAMSVRTRGMFLTPQILARAAKWQDDYLTGLEVEQRAKQRAIEQTERMATTVVSAFAAMAQAAAAGSRGILTSVIGGAAAIASVLPGVGPIGRAGILAGGGILSSLLGGRRESLPVNVRDFSPTAEAKLAGALAIEETLIIQQVNPSGDIRELMRQIRRLEQIDGERRIVGIPFQVGG